MASTSGAIAGLLIRGDVQHRLLLLMSKPITLAGAVVAFFILSYVNYRILMWRFERREQRRAGGPPIE